MNKTLLFQQNIFCNHLFRLRHLPLCLCLFFAKNFQANAQQLPICSGGENLASSCGAACIVCDLNGYSNTTMQVTPGAAPPGFCTQVVHNIGWVGFIAGSVNLSFDVAVEACTLGNSIEMGVYSAPNCMNSMLVSNCNTAMFQNNTYSFSNTSALTPGCIYFLVFDNNGPAACPFAVTVTSGSGSAPQPGPTPAPSGPTEVCPGATVTYSIPTVFGTCEYIWTAPPGSLINGLPSPQSIQGDAGATVDITFGNNTGDICVETGNVCATFTEACLPVTIATIPPTLLPPVSICNGASLEWIDGNFYSNNQMMSTTIPSWLGCDSVVNQQLIIRAPIINPIGTFLTCANDCVEVGGISFCNTGFYQVILTSYLGCDSTVIFTINQVFVNAVVAAPDTIDCYQTSALLDGSASTSNANYAWYNSQNLLIGTNDSLLVANSGVYLFVVEKITGQLTCRDSALVTVVSNVQNPQVTTTGDTINCQGDPVQMNTVTNPPGAVFLWTGPGIDSTNQHLEDPWVDEPGSYILTVTNPLNGCTAKDTATVSGMGSIPDLAVPASDTVDCSNPLLWLVASSAMPGVTFSWMAPDSTITASDSVQANQNGLWIAIATATGGCTNVDTSVVLIDTIQPNAVALGGILDCSGNPILIQGNSSTQGASFAWTGPGNFSAAAQDTIVAAAGTYVLTVSTPNGCTSTATAIVLTNTNTPNLSASGWDTLTCFQPAVWVSANSITSGAVIDWTGPGSFSATGNAVQITTPGLYTITATAPNGCQTSLNFSVPIDTVPPVVTIQGDTITCNNLLGHIIAFCAPGFIQYEWTGPGVVTPIFPETDVTVSGVYIIEATGPNGCPGYAQTVVGLDITPPSLNAATPSTITCDNASSLLAANSPDNAVQFSWAGPNAFSAVTDTTMTIIPGSYTVVATGTNGCSDSLLVTVPSDTNPPDLTATGGVVNCAQTSVQLNGQSITPGVTFLWSGPNGFISSSQSPIAIDAGTYQLTGTAPNGCTSIASTQVSADFAQPVLTLNSSIQTLTCSNTTAQLQVQSDLPGTIFQWSLQGVLIGSIATIAANSPGPYQVSGTAPNGCFSTNSIVINEDIAIPNAFATGDTLFCNSQNVVISGGSGTIGASLLWTGPGNFNSTQNMPSVNLPGDYILTVTGANGCTATATAQILPDATAPDLNVQSAAVITCTNLTTTLISTSNTPGVMFHWTGPGNFSASGPSAQTQAAGLYTIQVTGTNGCINVQTVTVTTDTILPTGTTSGGILTCSDTLVQLNSSSNTANVLYLWTGPGNFNAAQPNASTSQPGLYLLTLTAPNGCTGTIPAIVSENTVTPDIVLNGNNLVLTCTQTTAGLTGNSAMPNITWGWTGPGNFSAVGPNISVNHPGNYQATVTANNGCTATSAITVNQDITTPAVIATGGLVTCAFPAIQLSGQSGANSALFQWTGPGQFTANGAMPTTSLPGIYVLIVTGINGCTASATATVTADQLPPAFALAGGTITCSMPVLTAEASGFLNGTTFNWIGPGGFLQSGVLVTVSTPGTYQIIAQGSNGCTATGSLQIPADLAVPQIMLEGGVLNCLDSVVQIQAVVEPVGASISWSGPQQNLPEDDEIAVSLPGVYTMTATSANGCTAAQDVTIEEIKPAWTVDLGPDQTVWEGAWLNITAATELQVQDLADISWTPVSTCLNCLNQVFRAKDSLFLQVRIEDANGCIMTDGVLIHVRKRGEIYIPNVFSPDGDGINDEFRVFAGNPATRIRSLQIFDRWGSMVFEQENFLADETRGGWDGRYRGQALHPAVFVWNLVVEYEDGKAEQLSGDVTLKL